jgi:hypothetical protein
MSVLVVLNFGQATAVFGPYKKNHDCIPPLMYAGDPGPAEYIMHEEIDQVPELDVKINWDNLPRFTIGDGSDYDIHYQEYLLEYEP